MQYHDAISAKDAGKPATVLLSGGMDSSVLLYYVTRKLACKPVYALSFGYGQRHVRELVAARRQVAALGQAVAEHLILDLSVLREIVAGNSALMDNGQPVPELTEIPEAERDQPPTYVPNRNLIMLALAAAFAESRGCHLVFYGAQAHDNYGYWDCNRHFLQRLNTVLGLNRRSPVAVRAPFVETSKCELLRMGLEMGVDFGSTWSCYRGEDAPCRVCPTCVERRMAFHELGMDDPLGPDIN